jgi:hypothetical protein
VSVRRRRRGEKGHGRRRVVESAPKSMVRARRACRARVVCSTARLRPPSAAPPPPCRTTTDDGTTTRRRVEEAGDEEDSAEVPQRREVEADAEAVRARERVKHPQSVVGRFAVREKWRENLTDPVKLPRDAPEVAEVLD